MLTRRSSIHDDVGYGNGSSESHILILFYSDSVALKRSSMLARNIKGFGFCFVSESGVFHLE